MFCDLYCTRGYHNNLIIQFNYGNCDLGAILVDLNCSNLVSSLHEREFQRNLNKNLKKTRRKWSKN